MLSCGNGLPRDVMPSAAVMAATALPAVIVGLASTSSAATGPRKAAVCSRKEAAFVVPPSHVPKPKQHGSEKRCCTPTLLQDHHILAGRAARVIGTASLPGGGSVALLQLTILQPKAGQHTATAAPDSAQPRTCTPLRTDTTLCPARTRPSASRPASELPTAMTSQGMKDSRAEARRSTPAQGRTGGC